MANEKLSHEDLGDLASYSLKYPNFWSQLLQDKGEKITIKQFCTELAKEMAYHREIDLEQGLDVETEKIEHVFDDICSNPENCGCLKCPSHVFRGCESKWKPKQCCHECDEECSP